MPRHHRARSWAAFCAALAAIFTVSPPRSTGQTLNSWKAHDVTAVNWSNTWNWTAGGIVDSHIAVFSSNAARVYDSFNDLTGLAVTGIVVNNNNSAANPLTIRGNALGVSAGGIDMSAATTDLTVNTGGLTLAANQSWTIAPGRTLMVNSLLSGGNTSALIVTGGGTVQLNGDVSGLTNIQVAGGTVLLGSVTPTIGSGPVTLSGAATLGGTGTIVPNTGGMATNCVTLGSGTTLAPGIGGVGTLTVGSPAVHATAELAGGSTFAVDLGSAIARPATGIADINTNDRLMVYGLVDFSAGTGAMTIAVNGAGQTFTPGRSYDFVLAYGSDGLQGVNPAQFIFTQANFAIPGTFDIQKWNNDLLLTYSPVPEPAHVLIACLVTTGMGWWVRFWRRRWSSNDLTLQRPKTDNLRPCSAVGVDR